MSPLFFKTVKIVKKRKIETQFEVQETDDLMYSNPILVNALKRHFDVDLEDVIKDLTKSINDLVKSLATQKGEVAIVNDVDSEEAWQIVSSEKIGNFNYKKSSLAKDFDEISMNPSSSILQLFGDKSKIQDGENITPLLNIDISQKVALELATTNNIVLQGPPGTGKSQSIVNLIGHFLSQNKKVLFVSQKRSALDVVYERVSKLGLEKSVAYFNAEKAEKKEFYKVLRKAWENLSSVQAVKTVEDKNYNDGLLDFYLNDFIKSKGNAHSSSFLTKKLVDSGFKKEELYFKGTIPNNEKWESALSDLHQIDKKAKSIFEDVPLGAQPFLSLNKSLLNEPDPFAVLEKRIREFKKIILLFQKLIENFKLPDSIDELTRLAIAASILNMVNKSQLEILNSDSKAFKSFGNWAKKYELAESKYERQLALNAKWKNKPTKSEITELLDLVKHQHAAKGIFGLLRRRSERIDQAFEGFDPALSATGKQQLLEELRTEWNLKGELDEIKLKLKHNFGIVNPDIEVDLVFQVRSKLDKVNQSDYLKLLETDDSVGLIEALAGFHPQIQAVNHLLKFTFDSVDIQSISAFKKQITFLEQNQRAFKLFNHELKEFFNLDRTILDFIRLNSDLELIKLDANVVFESLKNVNKFVTFFDELNGDNLSRSLRRKKADTEQNAKTEAARILQKLSEEYQIQEELLSTPSTKLDSNQKTRKKRLKQQKKIMMHEIAKKQQHLSVQQFVSECWEYLSVFQKIWVMNPLAVSQRLPLDKDLFDVVIFDESSQIPLEDAIPAIQRSKQIIVVGDEKQMPPSQFFSTSHEQFTLLDQSQLSFKKEMFNWHYRSLSPELIQFSNWKFYNDNLLSFPTPSNESPIEFIKVEGVFHEGSNDKEATAIAEYISDKQDLSKVGVIAFSAEQEKLIIKKLASLNVQSDLLLVRNLENVQGIERDEIIISVGYAFNKEGVFRMNFGPVNKESGPNRLNVMFSRAKSKMTVFSSVLASDFNVSDNPGVNCLKEFLSFSENSTEGLNKNSMLPKELNFLDSNDLELVNNDIKSSSSFRSIVQPSSGKVLLLNPCDQKNESNDLATIFNVLSARFKEVKIVLSLDKWRNPDRFEIEIKRFFEK